MFSVIVLFATLILGAICERPITPLPSQRTQKGIYTNVGDLTVSHNCPDKQALSTAWAAYRKSFYNRDAPKSPDASAVTTITAKISNCQFETAIPMDEAYVLEITDKAITITANNLTGGVRALATLMQLSEPVRGQSSKAAFYSVEQQTIRDEAKYTYREALIDTSRHYLTLKTIKRTILGLSIAKYNILHLHLSDAESFSMKFDAEDSPADKLVAGAWGPEYVHTTDSMKELVEYALQFGVVISPEIDIPGHTYSWGKADRDIVANPSPSYKNINNYPLNPIEPKTYEYLRGVFNGIMRTFFKKHYKHGLFHLGGDEIVSSAWTRDPKIKAYMDKNRIGATDLLRDFHDWAMDVFQECALETTPNTVVRPVFWEEVFDDSKPGSHPDNSIFIAWSNPDMIPRIAKEGYNVVRLAGLYLDQMYPQGKGNTDHYSFIDVWQDFYLIDPQGDYGNKIPSAYVNKAIGGGLAVWGEKANSENLDTYIWPRSIAIGENLWSKSIPTPENRSVTEEITKRFNNFTCVLLGAGIKTGPLLPGAPCTGQHIYWDVDM